MFICNTFGQQIFLVLSIIVIHEGWCLELTHFDHEKLLLSIQNDGLRGMAAYMREQLDQWQHEPVNIAVIGQAGSGKSTFINVFRGLAVYDQGAADVDVSVVTTKPTPYIHPNNDMLALWEVPESVLYSKETCIKQLRSQRYDIFLILSSTQFTERDAWLAQKIKETGKTCYFARTKIASVVDDSSEALVKIRSHISSNLSALGTPITPAQVFLIDSHNRSKFDFELLENGIAASFPPQKKLTYVLSLKALDKTIIQLKMSELRQRVCYVSAISASMILLPIPGVGNVGDLSTMAEEVYFYARQLGLDDDSLAKLAAFTGADIEFLISTRSRSRFNVLSGRVNLNAIKASLPMSIQKVPHILASPSVEEIVQRVPIMGSAAKEIALSAARTSAALNYFLGEMEKAAVKLIDSVTAQQAGC